MMKKVVIVISLLAAAFVGVLAWAILTMNELDETRDILSSTKAQLEMTATELGETKDRLADTTNELTSIRSELSSTKNKLAITEDKLFSTTVELASTEHELSSTKKQLNSAQQKLSSTQATLASTQQQLDIAQETLSGLGITLSASKECYDVDLVDNPQAMNPTWGQLKAFLSQDKTETHTYIQDVYDCSQFSRDVHNNAEAAGIRAAEVHVEWSNKSTGHALNAFLTTDYGLVYVDCTGGPDTVARIKVGKVYRAVELYRITAINIRRDHWWDALDVYYYIKSSSGGQAKTSGIRIYW